MQNQTKTNLSYRLKSLVNTFVTGGMEPSKASLSISLGFLWGVFPLVGTSTVLCTASSLFFKLNMAIIQAVNYIVYPIQLALLLPYFYIGAPFTGFTINGSSIDKIGEFSFSLSSLAEISGDLLFIAINMLLGWLLLAPLASFIIYLVSKRVLTSRQSKVGSVGDNGRNSKG